MPIKDKASDLPQSLLDIRSIREAHFRDMVVNALKSDLFKKADEYWNELWDQTLDYLDYFYGEDEDLRLRVVNWEFERQIHIYEELAQLGLSKHNLNPADFISTTRSLN